MAIAPGTNPDLPWRAFYDAVDSMQMEPFLRLMHEDATMRYSNYPAVHGKAEIERLVADAWRNFKMLKHNFENVWEIDSHSIHEASIDHIMADGRAVTLPCVTIIEWRDGKAFKHRSFIDTRPIES